MKWLTSKSKELIAGLIGDFAKIILAGYFAGEFFAHLSSAEKFIFWAVFAFFVGLFLILTIEKKGE